MINAATMTRLFQICKDCATQVHNKNGSLPEEYIDSVTNMLFETMIQESGGIWERQRSVNWAGEIGAFSKWQIEECSIKDSLKLLNHPINNILLDRATQFIFNDPHASLNWPNLIPLRALKWALLLDDNDKLGCLFARLHYLRCKGSVPNTLIGRAEYWKKYFNTALGKGTVDEYIRHAKEAEREWSKTGNSFYHPTSS